MQPSYKYRKAVKYAHLHLQIQYDVCLMVWLIDWNGCWVVCLSVCLSV